MANAEVSGQTARLDVEVDSMRQKHSKRKNKRNKKNGRDSNVWQGSRMFPQPFGDASHCNWFWENYYNALEWQERHQIAYWKSRSIALEYENNLLHQYVQSLVFNKEKSGSFPTHIQVTKTPSPQSVHSSKRNKRNTNQKRHHNQVIAKGNDQQKQKYDSSQDEFEFQVTEEMMDFFEQSIRHKMELKKQREEEKKKTEKEKGFHDASLPPRKQVGLQRTQEMKLMYGEKAPMILGMETAMQLSFDRNCDLKQPKLWPNIPLKL